MPSRDPINPQANAWMQGENAQVRSGLASVMPKPKKRERQMSAQIERLARRTNQDPDELAAKIPEDTIRRTKYPVIEQRERDGTRTFKHDIGIKADGRHSRP